MNLLVFLLILFLLLGALPGWGWHHYGYGPSGILGFILIVLLILALLERI